MTVIGNAATNPGGSAPAQSAAEAPTAFAAPPGLALQSRTFFLRVIAVFFFVVPPFARAEPFTRDLGQGLTYHRVRQLPADLPTAETIRRQPCVLDLRYVSAAATEAVALEAWVKFRATARTPVIILANPDTAPALLAPFAAPRASAGIIVVGPAAPGFAPDIAVKTSRADERRAYDAAEVTTDLATVLNDSPAKLRNDEARLARDRNGDSPSADGNFEPGGAGRPSAAPRALDTTLLRAVHLHRTLLALKKL